MMDEAQRLEVFQAQTKNVQELERAWKHVNRQVNAHIRDNNDTAVHINAKLMALLYCALAEATFSKLIHTPHGLTLDEIEQVKRITNASGVKPGWQKCAELGVAEVGGAKSNHGPNVIKRITGLIDKYIFDPSLLRNKLAHGQWIVALNRENSAVNNELTAEIAGLDVVELYRRKYSLLKLARILEDIIESPNRAHHKDYWLHLEELEGKEAEIASWTMAKKVAAIKEKASFSGR